MGCQFHWFNQGFKDFSHYLEKFTSRKRKNIKKERSRLQESGFIFHKKVANQNKLKIAAKTNTKATKKVTLRSSTAGTTAKITEGKQSFAHILPKGATTDPVVDPNGYIKQNFKMMNNKELAVATGLSEHTIRRKLGEWGLKRASAARKNR